MTRGWLLAVAAAGLGSWACGGQGSPPDSAATVNAGPAASTVPQATADTVTVNLPLSLTAQTYVDHDALVFARARGIVESVYVDLGAPVERGQLLAELEHIDQEIALGQAREAFTQAERNVERQRELTKSGFVSIADSEAVEFSYRRAELALRQAERNYGLTRVVAPFAGVITSRQARPRRLVADGDSLFRVTAMSPLLVPARVPEGSADGLTVGSPAAAADLGGRRVAARVVRLSPAIDAASGTREVILQLAPHPGLRPGASVTVWVGTERRRVVAIPQEALGEQGYVLVLENGRSTLRAVTTGAILPDGRIEVMAGLSAGERVVLASR